MHQHHGHQHQHHEMEIMKRQGGTVVEYVYQTAAKTFDGPIGGYITAAASPPTDNTSGSDNSSDDADVESTTTTPASPTPTPEATAAAVQVDDTDTDTTSTSSTPTSTTPTSTSSTSTTSSTSSTPKKEVAQSTPSTTSVTSQSTSPTSSFIQATSSSAQTTSTAGSNSSSNGGGLSSGAKAGLAIGIILAVALLLGLLFFCFRRRRKQATEDYVKADDEKTAYMEGLKRSQSVTSTRTAATAPRLSLRPITQFMPDMAARAKAMNGAAPAAALGAVGGTTAAAAAAASRDHNDPENPFGNHAEVPRKSQGSSEKEVGLPIQNNAAEDPFGKDAEILPQTDSLAPRSMPNDVVPAPLRIRTPTPEALAIAGGAVAGAAGGLAAARTAEPHNAPKPLNIMPKNPVSPAASSPAVSEFSQTSMTAGAVANGPPPSNVHRIQLDFKPSMDDELGLRAGQLVRLLHEYDDGWALCIRLDRSQQGVAPRTCLSARPVKPRPAPGPGPRGPPPPGMNQQRPQSPASDRGSPNPHSQGRAPRPYNPAGTQRSMSPGPYGGGAQRPAKIPTPGGKRRSNSASEVSSRRNSPPGPSGLNPNVQRVPLQQQAVISPDQASGLSTPQSTMARKPVAGRTT